MLVDEESPLLEEVVLEEEVELEPEPPPQEITERLIAKNIAIRSVILDISLPIKFINNARY